MAWGSSGGNTGGDFGGLGDRDGFGGGYGGGFGGSAGGFGNTVDAAGGRGAGYGGRESDSESSRASRKQTPSGGKASSGTSTSDSDTNATRTGTRAAREDDMARRSSFSAQTAVDAFNLAQDPAGNLETAAQREKAGYQASSSADRRGTSISRGGTAPGDGSTRDGVAAAFGEKVSSGPVGLLAGFVPGGRALVDTLAENYMTRQVTGKNMGVLDAAKDFGKNALIDLAGNAVMGPVSNLLAGAGYRVGGMPGAVVGGLLANVGVNKFKGAVDEAVTYGGPPGKPFDIQTGNDSETAPLLRQAAPPAPQVATTGYSSTFGNYDSHLKQGYGFRSAFDAFS